MERLLKNSLLRGVRAMGEYDPETVLPFIEEELTFTETVQAEGFLKWVVKNKKTFGHGNIDTVFDEYMSGAIR